ncbi:MAG: transposase [Rhodobacter sp.]|nr:transposase [Rhodobacter sp.]
MPGAGPISALAVETFAPPMEQFTRARDFAAWLGLIPRQAPIGGTQKRGKTCTWRRDGLLKKITGKPAGIAPVAEGPQSRDDDRRHRQPERRNHGR